MNVDSILVSEFARIEPESSSLTIVGVFNQLVVAEIPVKLPALALSIVIHGHSAEANTSHKIEVRLLNQRRETINPKPIEVSFAFSNAPPPGLPLRHTAVVKVFGPVFPEYGAYAFEVYIDGTYHAGTVVYIGREE